MCLVQTSPDVSCTVSQATHVTEKRFIEKILIHARSLNYLVRHLKKPPIHRLRYPRLDKDSFRIQTYSDAAYSKIHMDTSQIGYVIFLADKYNSCKPLYWYSYKSKRVLRSVLSSETVAFGDAFDMTFSIKRDMEKMINKQIPLIMLKGNLSLFELITKSNYNY